MFDSNFDPYDAMNQMNANIQGLDRNLAALIQAHNNLVRLVQEQGETITVLTQGLNTANTANQILLSDMVADMGQKLKDLK
jgi:t-SNARE complex subunit (syntaxin)